MPPVSAMIILFYSYLFQTDFDQVMNNADYSSIENTFLIDFAEKNSNFQSFYLFSSILMREGKNPRNKNNERENITREKSTESNGSLISGITF